MKRIALLFSSIILFTLFHFSLSAKDPNARINLAATLKSSVEAPVWNCDLPALQSVLTKWIKVKDVQAIIVVSDSVSCSILRSEAIKSSSAFKNNESKKNEIISTVIRDNIYAHLEILGERSKNNELEEIDLKITHDGNEVGVLVIFFSVK